MLEIAFYMILAGCSADLTLCAKLGAPAVAYASADACMQDLAAAVQDFRSGWPSTHGVCRQSSIDRVAARPHWPVAADSPLAEALAAGFAG